MKWLTTDQLDRFQRAARCWYTFFQAVALVFGSRARTFIQRLVHMLHVVSNVPEPELYQALGMKSGYPDASEFLCSLRKRIEARVGWDKKPFRGAVTEVTLALFEASARHRPPTQKEMLARFLADRPKHERLCVHCLDLDFAFTRARYPELDPLPKVEFPEQVAQLAELARAHGPGRKAPEIIAFLGIDPRRSELRAFTEQHLSPRGAFRGIKLYPSMGFLPNDPRLSWLFDLCQDRGIPVLSHCSTTGAGRKGPDDCSVFSHPMLWLPVLERLAHRYRTAKQPCFAFKLCLAHFSAPDEPDGETWTDEIIALMGLFQDPAMGVEIYTDLANDVPADRGRKARRFFQNLTRARKFRNRILFGSDWWNDLLLVDDERQYLEKLLVEHRSASYFPRWDLAKSMNQAADDFLSDALKLQVGPARQPGSHTP